MSTIDSNALDQIFREARTHRAWTSEAVSTEQLHALYELVKLGPTSANSSPMRLVFVKSAEAKERLKPALDKGNVEKTMSAPVTAIVAYDVDFHKQMHKLNPGYATAFDKDDETKREAHATLNSALQGAYLIVAARSLGLDCGPMSGFDRKKVDHAFFAGTFLRSLFLVNLGHGDSSKMGPRLPRLDFYDAAKIV